ncbi:MAG TPA: response regulator transcription factor [Candidatus Sulfotelmatobacter sp.]|nr:response regulator transcription factor [Candidatus Sulfotelmatobacter sp.]
MPVRILIADDNSLVRTTLHQILKSPDHEIFEACDGAEAVAKTLQFQLDIVILDLAMPVMDGLTAARQISTQFPNLPILLCTMYWSPQLLTEAMRFGVRKVISKGESTALISAIQELLQSPDRVPRDSVDPGPLVSPNSIPPPAVVPFQPAAADATPATSEPAADVPPEKAS